MGMGQYLYADKPNHGQQKPLCEWRRRYDLHGWIEKNVPAAASTWWGGGTESKPDYGNDYCPITRDELRKLLKRLNARLNDIIKHGDEWANGGEAIGIASCAIDLMRVLIYDDPDHQVFWYKTLI